MFHSAPIGSSSRPALVALSVLVAGQLSLAPAAVAGDLPEEIAGLLPADLHALVTCSSLDEAEAVWQRFAAAEGEAPALRAKLAEMIPDLMEYVVGDRPLILALTLAPPMMPQPVSFTVVTPVTEEALNPPFLRTLAGDLSYHLEGKYLGLSNLPEYVPVDSPPLLAGELPAGVLTARLDLKAVLALYRPFAEMGLMAMSQQGAMAPADTSGAAKPPMTPEQIAAIQQMAREAMESLERLDLALDAGERPRLAGTLAVAPSSLFDPPAQPDFATALELSGYLPDHLPMMQVGAVDASHLMERLLPLYSTMFASAAEQMPPGMGEAYVAWLEESFEMYEVWAHPYAMAFGLEQDGLRFYGIMEHPDPAPTLRRIVDFYQSIETIGMGISMEELPARVVKGRAVRSFRVDVDADQMARLMESSPVDAEAPEPHREPAEMAALMARIYPTIHTAALPEHLVVCADPDPEAMVRLLDSVDSGGGEVAASLAAAAARAGDGTQMVTVGDMRAFMEAAFSWMEMAGEEVPELPPGGPVPFAMTGGARAHELDFALEADIVAFRDFIAAMEEWEKASAEDHGSR